MKKRERKWNNFFLGVFPLLFIFSFLILFAPQVSLAQGVNWTNLPNPWSGTSANYYDIYFTSQGGFVVGENGIILKTTTGGATWSQVSNSYSNTLRSISASLPTVLFAVGDNGRIIRLQTSTSNITSPTSGTTATLRSIYFFDSNVGFIVGDNGTFLRTTDGGTTWTQYSTGTSENLFSVYFPYDNTYNIGYTVGANGVILKTTTGGTSWVAQTSGTTNQLNSVQFPFGSIDQGYAVGDNGTILKTINGGASWVAQTSGTTLSLKSVQGDHVLAQNGLVLRTTNSGATWTTYIPGTAYTTNSLTIASPYPTFYAVGNAGIILKGVVVAPMPSSLLNRNAYYDSVALFFKRITASTASQIAQLQKSSSESLISFQVADSGLTADSQISWKNPLIVSSNNVSDPNGLVTISDLNAGTLGGQPWNAANISKWNPAGTSDIVNKNLTGNVLVSGSSSKLGIDALLWPSSLEPTSPVPPVQPVQIGRFKPLGLGSVVSSGSGFSQSRLPGIGVNTSEGGQRVSTGSAAAIAFSGTTSDAEGKIELKTALSGTAGNIISWNSPSPLTVEGTQVTIPNLNVTTTLNGQAVGAYGSWIRDSVNNVVYPATGATVVSIDAQGPSFHTLSMGADRNFNMNGVNEINAASDSKILGGGGSGATASVSLINAGQVTGINVITPGSGYTVAPTVTISGSGTGATAVANISGGQVSSITMTNGGSGYSFGTAVSLSGGGNGLYGLAFLYPSDRNLKENIVNLDPEESLDKILKLQGVSFDWKDKKSGSGRSIGFIAQDVEKVFPEVVSENDGIKAIDYAKLIAPMIEALKVQQGEIEQIKNEVAKFKK